MPSEIAPAVQSCPFCGEIALHWATAMLGSVLALPDKYPVTPGHVLVIPLRHTSDYFAMTKEERSAANEMIFRLRNQILESDQTVMGFNIGMNCGETAGQTIQHAHIHLIPRRWGDTPNPAGGVRGVLPGKMSY